MAGYTTPAWTDGTAPDINAAALTAMGQGIELAQHPYGVCSTNAAVAAKTVTVDYSGTLSLFAGLTVRVCFAVRNVSSNPTLNVNGTGAKAIMRDDAKPKESWDDGEILTLVYDGTNWVVSGGSAAKIESGSYTGSGVVGTVTANMTFRPVLLLVFEIDMGMLFGCGDVLNSPAKSFMAARPAASTSYYGEYGGAYSATQLNLTWGDYYVSWSVQNPVGGTAGAAQGFNTSGKTYYWIAIGE